MELFLIDAIGPFFRNIGRKKVNWSKIPFQHLAAASEQDWEIIHQEMRCFAAEVSKLGYNAVTLDDVAHLASHPLHEPEIASHIAMLKTRFGAIFKMLRRDYGLMIYLTTDVLPTTPAVIEALGADRPKLEACFRDLIVRALDDFPELSGIIMRLGESDGNDVKDPIRTRLHLQTAGQANRLLRRLLPEFERRDKRLILRTWTVGAHPIGDLIWRRKTLDRVLMGIRSRHLILSMKPGESDFFRYLPLNKALHRPEHPIILELQARREYEGAGEYPSFIGWECERYAEQLRNAKHLIGISVWCQTGGWHRFRRRAFLEPDRRDIWIRFNVIAAICVFRLDLSARSAVLREAGPKAVALLEMSEIVVRDLIYINQFAGQSWYFRRVRIPPIIHVYWDSILINHAIGKLMRLMVRDPLGALRSGEEAAAWFPKMIGLARDAGLPVEDIEHMRDFCSILLLARRYCFQPYSRALAREIIEAKKTYKRRWPSCARSRYRVKLSFEPFPVSCVSLARVRRILLRRQSPYRLLDRLFLLPFAGLAYRIFGRRLQARLPKVLSKSAMGIDVVFK